MIKQIRIATFKFLDILMILTMVLASPMSVSAAALAQDANPVLTLDKSEYAPGESVSLAGSGFAAGEYVLTATGPDGSADWATVTAGELGEFTATSPQLTSLGSYEVDAFVSGNEAPVASAEFTVSEPAAATESPTEAPTATEPPTAEPTQPPTDAPTATEAPTDAPTEPAATEPPATQPPVDVPTDTPTLVPIPLLTPFILSDKADYNPGELVTLTGGNWQGDTQVRIFVNDNLGQIWSRDVVVNVTSDGTVVDTFNLPTLFVAAYIVSASGQQTGRVVTTTFTDAAALTLTKSASPLTFTAAGQVINFNYVLTNTSSGSTVLNAPFTVTDNKVPSVSCPATPTTLAVGASITCTGTYTITSADLALGYAVNTATASSSAPNATTSNTDVRIVSIPVECRNDSDGANDEPGQKDLTQECIAKTSVNPLVLSWNWDVISMSGNNSADGCALFDTDNDGLANYAICVSWQGNRVMQAGFPQLYSCNDTRSDRCAGDTPLTISNGSACAVELAVDDPFAAGDSYPQDAKAFCSINLADVGGATKSSLIDVCSYPSVQPNSDPSDCVVISADKGNLEVIKDVVPDDSSTNWNISWTGQTPYSGTITGDGTTDIQAVTAGSYDITESAGTGTDLSLYDSTWACTVDGSASTAGSGTTITGRSVAKGSVVICTFTNTRKKGSLEIKKDVVPDNSSTNWNFALTGPDPDFTTCSIAGDGTCNAKTVFTGSYSITETAGSGTSLSDYGTSYACTVNGVAGASGTGTTISGLTINKNDTVVCTFTNSQSPGTLTVNKVVKPSTDTGKFNLQIDGVTKASDVGDGGTTGAVSVSAGSHTVGEIAGTGTDLNNYVTTISGDCDSTGTVSVSPNQNKTCTITNTRKGTIIVEKQTIPDGAAGSFTFTGDAAGTISDNGQIVVSNIAPGTYTSTESSLAADFTLDSISCDDGSSATPSTVDLGAKKATFKLDPGETVKCTFTNKKLNPDLAVTKTADAASVTAGDTVGFTISVKNNGLGTAYNVSLSDTLPAIPGVTWAIASQPSGDPCTLTGSSLSCTFGNLAPGTSTGDIHITGTSAANSCGTWNNTATAQADNNTSVTGTASIIVDCATIKISKTAGSNTVNAGDSISFTITVTNDNTGTAHNVTVTDNLPTTAGLNWTISPAVSGCSIAGTTLTCNFGDIAGGGSKTVTLTSPTTSATCGTVSNKASVTTSNDGSGDSTATITVQCPSLSVTKTPDAAAVNAGDAVAFTVTVNNAGLGTAKGVTISDTLPAGLTWSVDAANTTATGCSVSSATLSCGPDTIASGDSVKVHVTATSSPQTCGDFTNQKATATPTNGVAADSGPATITVNCADVTVTKTGNGPVSAADTATFTIKVIVTGSGSLSNVTLNDPLPTGVTWALDAAVTGCSISGSSPQTLSCSWATLAAPQTIAISVSGTTSPTNCAAPLSNTATVAAANETDTTNDTVNASITVNCATIQIEKTTSTPTVSAGDPISYTINVSNPGLGTANNVVVTDSLPGGLTWTISPAVSGCSISGSTLTCNFGSIASGGSKSVTVTATTTADNCGTLTNTASVTTGNDGSATTPNTDITVQCPSLSVTKTADAASVSAGDTIGFTITVSNAGPGEAKGVSISDSLPGGLAWTVDAGNTTATGCSVTAGVLSCGPNTIASGGSIKVHITAVSTSASCGTLTNSATATPTNGDAATSQSSTITVLCPDLTVAKTGNGPISASDTASFTITVTNTGLGVAKGVTITDNLPSGLTWTVDAGNTTATGCLITAGVLTCGPDTIAPSGSVKVTVSALTSKDNCGTLTNSASAAATNEQNTSNNSSGDANITVNCANIIITKTTDTPTVSAGETIHYTITVTNIGDGVAHNVTVTDTLPANAGLNWTAPGCSISNGVLTCTLDQLPAHGAVFYFLTSSTTYASCGTVSNTASVTTSNDGGATSLPAIITVNCPALAVSKTADAVAVSAGDQIGYTITVTNTGDGIARNVSLSDTLPTGTGINWSESPDNADCSISSGTLTCTFGDLAKGASKSVHITSPTTKDSCSTYHNIATASADNQSTVTSGPIGLDVLCTSISITKTADATSVSAGDMIGFTITVTNTGSGNAYGVTVTDTLPTNTDLNWTITAQSSGDPLPCSISGGVLTCNFGTIAAGMNKSVRIRSTTTAATCGEVDNTAHVTTSNDGSTDASASITVNCPDLTITKAPDAASVSAGDAIGFTITVKNDGLGKAYGVSLSDTLPTTAGTSWTIDPANAACTITAGVLSCTVGTLNPSAVFSVHVSSPTTPATCGGTVDNTATVTATNEAATTNNSAGSSITVNCPSLTVTKTPDAASVNAGDVIGFTITVSNGGPGTAKSVSLTDTLPSGSGISWTLAGGSGAAYCAPITGGVLTCNFGDMPASTTYTVHVTSPTDATSCGTYNNTAKAVSANQADVTGTGSTTVNCASISITKTTDTAIVSAGDPIHYTLVVTNGGDGTAHGVTITDILPNQAGLAWTVDPTVSGCSVTLGVLTCNLGDLAGHTSQTIILTSPTTYLSCAALSNTASVTTSNDGSGNSVATTITVNCPALTVTKTVDAVAVSAGDQIGYTITVTNTGDGIARNVSLTDTLPTGTGINWSIASSDPTCSISGTSLSCTFGDLAKGDTKTVHITSPTTKDSCGTYHNTATASADNQSSVTSGPVGVDVNCSSISITKTADTGPFSAGDPIGFTITVTNTGSGNAYGVTITDTLPSNTGLSWQITSQPSGNPLPCSIASGVLTCNLGTLAPHMNMSVRIRSTTTAASCGTVNNTAHVTTTNDGSGDASASITVNCPDVTVTKTAANSPVNAGDSLGFNITVTNNGTGTARNVTLSDTLPTTSGLDWSVGGTDGATCTIASGVVTCSFGDLAPTATKTITLTSPTTKDSCATINNTATVAATNEPTGQPNNSSTAGITVNCAHLTISKNALTPTVSAGQNITFQIFITNDGQGWANNVSVTDTLPNTPGLNWTLSLVDNENFTPGDGCAISVVGSNQVLSCNFAQLPGGRINIINVTSTTTFDSCGTVSNTASVNSSNDGSATSDAATVTVNCPALTITKTADHSPVNAGESMAFNIIVTNTGAGTAKNVVVTDPLLTTNGVTWHLGSIYDEAACTLDGNYKLTCNFGDLAPGDTKVVRLSGSTNATSCGSYPNTATVTADNTPTLTASATIVVNCPSLTMTKVGEPSVINAGETGKFVITIQNTGAGKAYFLALTDVLPANYDTVTSVPAWDSVTFTPNLDGTTTLLANYDNLAAGGTITVTITLKPITDVCGTISNTASLTARNISAGLQASGSITVNCPDVKVTKTAGTKTGTIDAGDPLSFDITVENIGVGTAKNVTLSDTLPTGGGLNWSVGGTDGASCSITSGVVSCNFGDLAPNVTKTITLTSPTTKDSCGTYNNTATVTSTNEYTHLDNNSSTASVTTLCAAISITKVPDKFTVNAGDPVSFTITVKNTGAGTAKDLVISDTLPANPGLSWSLGTVTAPAGSTGSCNLASGAPQVLTCNYDKLGAGESISIHVSSATTLATACASINNTASVNTSNDGSAEAKASITVTCANISITKESLNGNIISAGDQITYSIVVTNNGLSAASKVVITDTLPTDSGLHWTLNTYGYPVDNPGTCAVSTASPQVLTCSFDRLDAGKSIEVHVVSPTTYATCGTVSNIASVTTSNDGEATTPASKVTVNCPAVEIVKAPDTQTVSAGDPISFTITVTNTGAGAAHLIQIIDQLPLGVTWTINNQHCFVDANGQLYCGLGDLDPGASISVTLTANTTPAMCGTFDNTATVKMDNGPDVPSNTVSVTVNCPDVKVTKTAASSTIHVGQDAIFNIVVENIGAGKAKNVTLSDTLPGTVTWSLVQPLDGSCTLTGSNLSCAWPSLDPGAKITIQVKATIGSTAQCSNLTNTVTVTAANEKDSDKGNNTSTATITVSCPLDLTVTKTATPTFKREFCWGISKSVDKTFVRQASGSVTFNYTVKVWETSFCDSDWKVTGKITVTNPNSWLAIPITSLTDQVNNGGACTVLNYTAGAIVPKGGSLTYDYVCTYGENNPPNPYSGTNTATVSWDASIGTPHGTNSAIAPFTFGTGSTGNPTEINKTVTVTDTFNGVTQTLGKMTATTTKPYTSKTFTYSYTVPVPTSGGSCSSNNCKNYTNKAKIVETWQSVTKTVTVCGPIKTGAKTIGYWQNTNGQSIIKNASSLNGVCKLGTWLRLLPPFQDLSASASCSTVATYVYNVIKAANASGASMNAMLKAQMLATALDVYFSNSTLGGNKIGAPAPIGGVTIDLTYIYAGGSYINVSAAFGGATKLTVMQMLTYAASKSNVGGSMWYGNVKTTQQKAKNAFDAINNNWVFAP